MIERMFKATDRYGATTEFELRSPTLAIENEGERQYRIAYNRAIADGIYPRNRLREAMRQHKMWSEEDELAMKTVVGQLAILQIELEHAQSSGDDTKCLKIATDMRQHRYRMFELFMIQQSVYINSAEGLSELIKAEVVMAACTNIKATNERYWKNYTEFVRERDENAKSTVYANIIDIQTKILQDTHRQMEETYAENKYLKDVKTMILDREIQERVEEELQKRATEARKLESENGHQADQAVPNA